MIDPTRERQLSELEAVNLCTEILANARNELYLNMRFLDVALSSLRFEASPSSGGLSTDGFTLYYDPEDLFRRYQSSRIRVNRAYLHMVLHCLFLHMDNRGDREIPYWNLACDIAAESIMDDMYQRCVYGRKSPYRRTLYLHLKEKLKVLNAEGIYSAITSMNLTEEEFLQMASEFYVDDHGIWYEEEPRSRTEQRRNQWDNNREKMQTELETFSQEASEDSRSLLDQVRVENRERYDYKQFLRKFSVMKEEIQVDPDSFDYVFYTYGLSMYGNMPLVEPLETKEVHRIEDFVIAIDTSMSCSGQLVKHFLEETYSVLAESESYFKRVNIHIIQCDDKIQSDQLITSKDEMQAYMRDFTVIGQGGTDFRPAFEYVNQLIRLGRFTKLKGLIYFTDGKGIYPVKMPPYETAFVFLEDQYEDLSVPPWAIKLILTPEDIE